MGARAFGRAGWGSTTDPRLTCAAICAFSAIALAVVSFELTGCHSHVIASTPLPRHSRPLRSRCGSTYTPSGANGGRVRDGCGGDGAGAGQVVRALNSAPSMSIFITTVRGSAGRGTARATTWRHDAGADAERQSRAARDHVRCGTRGRVRHTSSRTKAPKSTASTSLLRSKLRYGASRPDTDFASTCVMQAGPTGAGTCAETRT